MNDLLLLTRALADESRLRIVAALRGGELCVCQLIELLELAPSTVSKHLALLRQARLLDVRKDGRWAYYRLAEDRASTSVRHALALLDAALDGDRRAAEDADRLVGIVALDPELLCCRQRELPAAERRRARHAASVPPSRAAARVTTAAPQRATRPPRVTRR
jgi:DNA-binding transcriptional ArsR family regulator